MLDRGPPPLESPEIFGRCADVWQHVFTYYRADCILCDSDEDPLWLSPGPRGINTKMAKFHETDLKCFGAHSACSGAGIMKWNVSNCVCVCVYHRVLNNNLFTNYKMCQTTICSEITTDHIYWPYILNFLNLGKLGWAKAAVLQP